MKYAIYDLETGLVRSHLVCDALNLAINIPAGCAAVPGEVDYTKQKVDVKTGQVIAYTPPPPSAEEIAKLESNKARSVIEQLEAQQHRRVRELLAANDPQLSAIDSQIAEQRTRLKK